ncbi:hypothetical protein [Oligoflexus tunisiensis]|uniref:hypothetical protein n=1 Tax=Oligoflexus tunisiensis TaxID=708132 RepID=UPI00114CC803|nr:hypothetical protein [Oligoflexus tunisiensis]
MKKPLYVMLLCLLASPAAWFGWHYASFDQEAFLVQQAESRYKIKIKETGVEETDRRIKLVLMKEVLLSEYLGTHPDAYLTMQEKLVEEQHPFIITAKATGVSLLNLSDRKCRLDPNREYAVPVQELKNKYCFSEDNALYFEKVPVAEFRITPLEDVSTITDEGVQEELKVRLKELVKQEAVAAYIAKHRPWI